MDDKKFMDGLFDTDLNTCKGLAQVSQDIVGRIIVTIEDQDGGIVAQAEGSSMVGMLLDPKDIRLGTDIVDRDGETDGGSTSMGMVWLVLDSQEAILNAISVAESLEETIIPLIKSKIKGAIAKIVLDD